MISPEKLKNDKPPGFGCQISCALFVCICVLGSPLPNAQTTKCETSFRKPIVKQSEYFGNSQMSYLARTAVKLSSVERSAVAKRLRTTALAF